MSDVSPGDNVPPPIVSDDPVEPQPVINDNKQNTVKYESYRKAVGDLKKWKARAEEFEAKFTEKEQTELERDGKKDELIDQLRKQNAELGGKLKNAVGNFTIGKAYDVIVDRAVSMGCTSTKLLKKIVADELQTLDYDDEFNPNEEQVIAMLEKVKKEEPILFQKTGPKINSNLPQTRVDFNAPSNGLDNMSKAELEAQLVANHTSLVDE